MIRRSGIFEKRRMKKFYSADDAGLLNRNYWGNASDGVLSTSGNVYLPNIQDGDVVVKQYTSLTINAGHTFTTQYRCRGLMIYVNGDCVINGTLSMTARGCKCNPADTTTSTYTPVAPSDGNAVGVNGIRFVKAKSGSNETLSASEVNGCGNALKNIEANQNGINGNGKIYTIPRVGASGGATCYSVTGNAGNSGGWLQSGGGGSGSNGVYSVGGAGAAGTCFSGGSGGGQGAYSSSYPGDPAYPYGGAGGLGRSASGYYGSGGAGNPGGSASYPGSDGTGGLLILFVRGNLTIGSGAVISSDGSGGGTGGGSGGGGSSGGGIILMLYAGALANNGTLSAAGGASGGYRGPGGAGSAVIEKIDL